MVRRRRRDGRWYEIRLDGSERLLPKRPVDRSHLDAMTGAEKLAAARSDPDARPLTEDQLKRMKRSPFAKRVRQRLDLSQEEFASVFGIPIGTLRDWEQGRADPDQAAQSYLRVIARNPKAVRKTLEPTE